MEVVIDLVLLLLTVAAAAVVVVVVYVVVVVGQLVMYHNTIDRGNRYNRLEEWNKN